MKPTALNGADTSGPGDGFRSCEAFRLLRNLVWFQGISWLVKFSNSAIVLVTSQLSFNYSLEAQHLNGCVSSGPRSIAFCIGITEQMPSLQTTSHLPRGPVMTLVWLLRSPDQIPTQADPKPPGAKAFLVITVEVWRLRYHLSKGNDLLPIIPFLQHFAVRLRGCNSWKPSPGAPPTVRASQGVWNWSISCPHQDKLLSSWRIPKDKLFEIGLTPKKTTSLPWKFGGVSWEIDFSQLDRKILRCMKSFGSMWVSYSECELMLRHRPNRTEGRKHQCNVR